MIKFPTANGIATVTTKKKTLYKCRRMEEAQGPALEGRITFSLIPIHDSEGTTSIGREESQGRTKEEEEPEDTVQPPPNPPEKHTQTDEEIKGKDEHPERPVKSKPPEKVVIHDDCRIKPFLSEETCWLGVDSDSLKYYRSMPMLSLGLWKT
ncbi:hypothetical protein Tco_1541252 [Tanacetum coccineum]